MAVSDYDPIIEAAAKEWDVDPNWARAVMHHESGGNPVDAQGRPIRSSAGAGGLMQIIPRTAADLGVQNVDNPVENIWGGVKYLAQLRDQFGGNVANATAAYNAGPDRVSARLANGTPLPPETQAYLPSVAGNYQRFAARYPARPAAAASSAVAAAPKTPIAAPASPASGAMADDDFLKRAAGSRPQTSAGTGAVLPDDEFLKRAASGGNVSTAAPPPVVPDAEDIQPRPGNAPEAMFNAAIRGAKEGWQNTPDILSPAASQWLSDHGLGVIGNNTGLPSYLWKGAAAAGNALTSAATTGVTRAAEGIGDQSAVLGRIGNFPLLGRDLAAMAENPLAAAPHGMIPANGNPMRPSAFDAALNERVAQIHRGNPLATDTAPAALTGEMRSAVNGPSGNPLSAPASTVPVFGRLRAPAPIENASGSMASPANPLASVSPPFIPPGSQIPIPIRLHSLFTEDARLAAARPSEIPPGAVAVDPLTGHRAAIVQPGNAFAAAPPMVAHVNPLASPPPVPLAPAAAPLATPAPPLPGVPGAPDIGVPRSAGAAASREMTAPEVLSKDTPAQRATALQKLVNQSAEDRLTPQGRDDAVYFPGVERPEAMRDFSPAPIGETSSAIQHKVLYNTDTNYHDQFDARVKKNNDVMVEGLHDMFGDANARDAAMNHAKTLMPGSIDLFAGEKAVDARPIAARINDILAGPAGKRDAVRNQLNAILANLKGADGNLEQMPSMLKGVRDDITDKLYDKTPTVEGNAARTARNQLQEVLGVVDDTIGKGLPGTKYKDYLANLTSALGQVSKLDYMQQFLTGPKKLTDPAGHLQLTKINKMLDDIQKHHADRTGGAPQMTMDEINMIEAARNELAAKDLLDRRGAVRGSPTAQLTNASGILGSGPLGAGVKGAAEALTHAGLAATTGGVGNALLGGYKYIVKPAVQAAKDRKAAQALAATKNRLLSTAPSPNAIE